VERVLLVLYVLDLLVLVFDLGQNNSTSKSRTYSTSSTLSTESEPEAEQAVKLSFSVAGLAGSRSQWEAVLWQNRLYVAVTQDQLLDGSKHGFISLLEYAEDELGVDHVVACLPSQACNKNIIRNFLFLGFTPLDPGHEFFPLQKPDVACFLYTI
jgi:ornithine decarboxylase antizyme 1